MTPPTHAPAPTTPARLARGLLVLGLVVVVPNLVLGATLPWLWGDPRLDASVRAWESRRDTIDTLFVGSSLTHRHVDPAVIDAALGTCSFNLGVDGQHLPQTARLLEDLLAHEDLGALRLVVLELGRFTSAVDPHTDHTKVGKAWRAPRDTASMLRYLRHRRDKSAAQTLYQGAMLGLVQLESSLHVGLGVDLLDLWLRDPASRADTRRAALGPRGDGFWAVDREAEARTGEPFDNAFRRDPRAAERLETLRRRAAAEFAAGWASAEPPNPEGLRRLRGLFARAEARGVRLVLLVPPRLADRYRRTLPLARAVGPEHALVALADPRRHPELYRVDESIDLVHLDHRGAARYSRLLADALSSTGAALDGNRPP